MRLHATINLDSGRLCVNDLDKPLADNLIGWEIETTASADAFLAEHGIVVAKWVSGYPTYDGNIVVAQGVARGQREQRAGVVLELKV